MRVEAPYYRLTGDLGSELSLEEASLRFVRRKDEFLEKFVEVAYPEEKL